MDITAVIPTRGDVDLGPITEHLKHYPAIHDIVVIVGSTPFNRYMAASEAETEIIFTQDDDCITDINPLIEAYEPGIIVNAMTLEHAAQYPGRQSLIGFGAIFDRELVDAVLDTRWIRDDLFFRESDRIFGTIHPHKSVFPKITILPYANAPNRLWKQADHLSARFQMERRILEVTGLAA